MTIKHWSLSVSYIQNVGNEAGIEVSRGSYRLEVWCQLTQQPNTQLRVW